MPQRTRLFLFSLLLVAWTIPATAAEPANPRDLLAKAKSIVFLGDSITYAGGYVGHFDAWLLTKELGETKTVINVGLPSETVSGLSEDGHAGGRFPRPDLAERLDRVLKITRPQLVFACYGINCGIYQPFDKGRFAAYQKGIRSLKSKVEAAGAKLILVTPPFYDDARARNRKFSYNAVLDKYAAWLVSQRRNGWTVIDLHSAMAAEVQKQRKKNPKFTFQPDAVHPNAGGHRHIAKQLIIDCGDEAAAKQSMPKLLESRGISMEALKLVQQRMRVRRDAYLSAAGHKRPGIRKGLPLKEAEAQATALTKRLREQLTKR